MEKSVKVKKNGSRLEKWVTLGIMDRTWKMGHTWKNGANLEKWVTLREMAEYYPRAVPDSTELCGRTDQHLQRSSNKTYSSSSGEKDKTLILNR